MLVVNIKGCVGLELSYLESRVVQMLAFRYLSIYAKFQNIIINSKNIHMNGTEVGGLTGLVASDLCTLNKKTDILFQL